MPARPARKVLLVGWDAADWKMIHPLMDAGLMPGVQSLVDGGVMANLATLHPVLSPMLWTTIATGVRPYKHGIHGFSEPTPDGVAVQPVTNLSRKVKAFWNILNQNDYRSIVIGWWPSHPAEPIDGVMVSNHYQRAVGPPDQPWPMAPGTVHPPRLAETLAELRLNPNALEGEHVLPFIPRAGEIDQEKDRRLASCAKITAECTSVHNAALWLMENEPWDLMAVYYDALDHYSHGFMKYHPPRRDHIRERDYELYKNVVAAGYVYHDMMLRALLERIDDDTTVILLSDHGFHPDHLRPRQIPREPAGPAVEHRDFGILVMKGPNIKQDQLIFGATLLDIAPTLLTVFGLPVGENLDGKILLDAFVEPPEIESVASWEEIAGPDGQHPPDRALDPHESKEALEQLVALGYIEAPGDNQERAVARTVRELDYNLARSFMHAEMHNEARPILDRLYRNEPQEHRFGIQLAMCYRAMDMIVPLTQLLKDVRERREQEAAAAREELKKFRELALERRKERREQTQPQTAELSPAPTDDENEKNQSEPDQRKGLFSPQERRQIARLRGMASINAFALDYLDGCVAAAQGNQRAALQKFRSAEKAERDRPALHIQVGESYLSLGRWRDAARSFRKAARIDYQNPHIHLGLARSYLGLGRNRLAASKALETIGTWYHYPMAHYCLGVALHRLGRNDRAVEALNVALSQNPNFAEAHDRLADIYDLHDKDAQAVAEHRGLARQLREHSTAMQKEEVVDLPPVGTVTVQAEARPQRENPRSRQQQRQPQDAPPGGERVAPIEQHEVITVVSGLPRSGTSMMMQMLEAGGLDILSDQHRKADEDNPRGYFELERLKRLREDADWLADAEGKVIKVIVQLLPLLPAEFPYRIIFMNRPLDEILASQRKMLDRSGRKGADLSAARLKTVFTRQVNQARQLLARRRIPTLAVSYRQAIVDPAKVASQVNQFLECVLDEAAMAARVDPSLHRQRS